MLRAQEDTNPDWGFLSLWNCHQLPINWFRILLRLASAEPSKAPRPHSERCLPLPGQAGIAPLPVQGRWRSLSQCPLGSLTRLGPRVWRPESQYTFSVAASVHNALKNWSVGFFAPGAAALQAESSGLLPLLEMGGSHRNLQMGEVLSWLPDLRVLTRRRGILQKAESP